MIKATITSVFAVIEVALCGSVEPYQARVQMVNYKYDVKLFRPDLVKVSFTEHGDDLFRPTAEVIGRYPRNNSGNWDTGGTGKIMFEGQHDEDIDSWPTYVQEAVWAARKVVNVP